MASRQEVPPLGAAVVPDRPAPWPLGGLAPNDLASWRVVLMVGASRFLHKQIRKRLPVDAQLLIADPDGRRLRSLWADALLERGAETLFFDGSLDRLFREFAVVPSAILIEASVVEQEQTFFANQLREKVAGETRILVYGRRIGLNLDVNAWSNAGFGIRAIERSRALILPRVSSRQVTALAPAAFRIAAARRAKALFGSAASGLAVEILQVGQVPGRAAVGFPGQSSTPTWPYARHGGALPATMPDGSPWPRISIVTPSFNQGAFIEETILSVANQGYPNLEHIVIDGGSTDETKSVLARHSDLLAYWESEPDRGQSHAINKGMARTSGEILTWLNSDDRLAPGALAAVAMAFHRSRADVVAGIAELYQDNELIGRHITACGDGPLPLDDILDLKRCWYAGQFFYQPEVMFTRAMWERAGGRVDESLFYSMDYELWFRFAAAGARLHVIGRPVAQFRMHASQKTHVTERFMAELQGLNDKLREKLGKAVDGTVPQARKLNVTLLNDVGFHYGAGTAHQRLAQALAWNGSAVTALSFKEGLEGGKPDPIDIPRTLAVIKRSQPDIVVLGNLHSAGAAPELIEALAACWPTFVVMHDFWLLTGRCAYAGDCEKLIGGCDDSCPTADQYPVLAPQLIAPAWRAKRRILDGARAPILLANSRYTEAFARRALGTALGPIVEAIRLGVPTEVFVPHDKSAARRILDIPEDAFVVLAAATAIDDPRKGGDLLAAALAEVRIPNLLVVAAGWYDVAHPSPIPGLRRMGYIDEPGRMALLYAAADLFVGPSREETFGQVFVEAAACGTPSVAFRTSGVVDAVEDGVSGVLVPELSAPALAEAIRRLHANPEARRRMSAFGRIFAESEYSLAKCQHSFMAMLIRTGVIDRLRLPRNASMRPSAPALECRKIAHRLTWNPGPGIGAIEGPFPEAGLPAFRWCEGPVSALSIDAPESGPHRLEIAYANPPVGQRVVLACNKRSIGEFELTAGAHAVQRVSAVVPLNAGSNRIELVFRTWYPPEGDNRALALRLVAVRTEPERQSAVAA
jgi:glycosyltransferase involved in cell wall biosynthesis